MHTMKEKRAILQRHRKDERGSLALEHILFITAVVVITGAIYSFYDQIATYFNNITVTGAPTGVGSRTPGTAAP